MRTAFLILAAGQGKRMRSETVKVLHRLLGEPVVHYPVGLAVATRPERCVVVVGRQAAEVEASCAAAFPGAVETVLQAEQRGTGDAVRCGLEVMPDFEGRVVVLCGDAPLLSGGTLDRLLDAGCGRGAAVLSFLPADPSGYGRIVRMDGRVRIVEERDATAEQRRIGEVNSGSYCFDAGFLRRALGGLSADNSQREFYLTDVVGMAPDAAVVVAADPDEALGINSRADLAKAWAVMRDRINRSLMDDGVSLLDPASAWIDRGVALGPDTIVHPQVRLEGATRAGAACVIESGCCVRDSELGAGVHLRPYCVLSGARLGDGAVVGPFAHLRPGTVLERGAKAGNFVEVKKARIGPGSKVNHLSYIGDADIGAGVNIGAGTITCNYDGVDKHRTVIGDDVFVGSDTQFVAPVAIGRGAVIGAGSTITRDVPEGALALSRSEQKDIPGYAGRRRRRSKE